MRFPRLPRTVWMLGLVSLFMDRLRAGGADQAGVPAGEYCFGSGDGAFR
ncbi:MAG: hypothetical protein R3E93_12820 [Thiothrix sp.]